MDIRYLGIEDGTGDVYEQIVQWRRLSPVPMVSAAEFLEVDIVEAGRKLNFMVETTYVFREDSFDPVTRVRRGRLYVAGNKGRPSDERTPPPATHCNASPEEVKLDRRLYVFQQCQNQEIDKLRQKGLLVLGSLDSQWRYVSAERVVTGEYLVTLKARNSLGVLPELALDTIPENGKGRVVETIDALTNASYRADPVSIVDRARDAAQWCLAVWAADTFSDKSLLKKDLSALADKVEQKEQESKPSVKVQLARVIARLHSRGKPNEQHNHGVRPVMESDAEFALAAVGLILREIKWARA